MRYSHLHLKDVQIYNRYNLKERFFILEKRHLVAVAIYLKFLSKLGVALSTALEKVLLALAPVWKR